jgi:phosphoesterase RecJ-like protein
MSRAKPSPRGPRTPGVAVPAARRRAAAELARLLKPGMRVALTTHVNADGDGLGSEVALWHMLTARGVRAAITNPTLIPERYAFLLRGHEHADKSAEAVKHMRRADAVVVLDISELGRLGQLGRVVQEAGVTVCCVDHHASNCSLPLGARLVDPKACATGELIYDLGRAVGWPLTVDAARALYVAILTDTGGFRFSNTSPRALQVAAHLLGAGLDPEDIYREVYATAPEGRVRLLGEVLDTLVTEHDIGLAWVTVPPGALERYGVDPEALEGVAEFPRSIKGMRLALLFRQLANGRVKISFRSVGDVDVAELAAQFGGGGHKKAAGASVPGTLADVQARVLAVARERLRRHA